MRTILVTTEWRATHEIEVPDDWEYDGLGSLTEHDDLSVGNGSAELLDWEWKEVS